MRSHIFNPSFKNSKKLKEQCFLSLISSFSMHHDQDITKKWESVSGILDVGSQKRGSSHIFSEYHATNTSFVLTTNNSIFPAFSYLYHSFCNCWDTIFVHGKLFLLLIIVQIADDDRRAEGTSCGKRPDWPGLALSSSSSSSSLSSSSSWWQ